MIKVNKVGSVPSSMAPADNFSGTVRRDGLISSEAPGRVAVGMVTFEPGGRTAWHRHPAGQILVVTAGCGWVQADGETRHRITPGDSVWIPPLVRHWHGASETNAMTHIAITEAVDGTAVEWLEHVSDDHYRNG